MRMLLTLLGLGSLAVASGCSGSDDTSDESAGPVVTVAPVPSATATTSEPTDPTSPPTDPTAPAPTDPTPAPTSTVDPTEGAIDAAASTIWGMHLFAERPSDDVVHVIADRLGEPTTDTGFLPMPEAFDCTGQEAYRVTRWGDLRITFAHGRTDPSAPDVDPLETERMIAWSVGDDTAAPLAPTGEAPADPTPTGITTGEGIGIGSSRDDVLAAYGDDLLGDGGAERVNIYVSGAGGSVPVSTAIVFDGDTVVGIGAGAPDCIDPDENL